MIDEYEDGWRQAAADWVWENKFQLERYEGVSAEWRKGYTESYQVSDTEKR
jgi:hypothetical protein